MGDICNIAAFYHKYAPMFTLSQPTTGYCTPTHPPSTSFIHFSVCISQACVASHKWISSGVPGKELEGSTTSPASVWDFEIHVFLRISCISQYFAYFAIFRVFLRISLGFPVFHNKLPSLEAILFSPTGFSKHRDGIYFDSCHVHATKMLV